MIRPVSYNDVFDRHVEKNGEQIDVLLFIRAPGHWCTLKSNLYVAQDAKNIEASFLDTLRLLNVQSNDEFPKDKLEHSIQSLRIFCAEVFMNEKILKFHESKQIQFKCFTSVKPLLHKDNSNHTKAFKRQISAFANTSGGIMFLGVDDNGTIIGEDLIKEENSIDAVQQRDRKSVV